MSLSTYFKFSHNNLFKLVLQNRISFWSFVLLLLAFGANTEKLPFTTGAYFVFGNHDRLIRLTLFLFLNEDIFRILYFIHYWKIS